jgi:hypothetical protein
MLARARQKGQGIDVLKHTYRINNGSFGICGVEVFRRRGRLTVVFTELHDNPGLSVTNCYEYLATDIVIGLIEEGMIEEPTTVRWIEHYEAWPARGRLWARDTWDEVTLDWDGTQFHTPTWRKLKGKRSPRLGTPLELHKVHVECAPHAPPPRALPVRVVMHLKRVLIEFGIHSMRFSRALARGPQMSVLALRRLIGRTMWKRRRSVYRRSSSLFSSTIPKGERDL